MERKNAITEYKRHIEDTEKALINKENSAEGHRLWLLYKKTEKLITATYLITDFFSEAEPLRTKLRERSLSLMSLMRSFAHKYDATSGERTHASIAHTVFEILALYELAAETQLISKMNFSILHDEYRALLETLSAWKKADWMPHDFIFPERFFSASGEDAAGEARQEDSEKHFKGHTATNRGDAQKDISKLMRTDAREGIKDSNIKDNTEERYSARRGDKSIRRTKIIQILRTRGTLPIKDISSAVGDCSEKTVQRELMSLIGEGVVKRTGARRWSTYSLNLVAL